MEPVEYQDIPIGAKYYCIFEQGRCIPPLKRCKTVVGGAVLHPVSGLVIDFIPRARHLKGPYYVVLDRSPLTWAT